MRLGVLMSLASPWSRQTATRLSELGFEVHVIDIAQEGTAAIYLSVNDDFLKANLEAFRHTVADIHLVQAKTTSNWRYPQTALQLRRILRKCKVDALLTLYGGGFATMAQMSGFRPYGVYVVGSDVLRVSGFRKRMGRVSLQAARQVFANGEYLAGRARELAPGASITPLLLGVDSTLFQPGSPPKTPIRITCTRGFLPVYNNEYLVRGLACLSEDVPDYEVTFVSPGPLLEEVRALADEILAPAVRQRVTFLGGVSGDRLLEILRESHVYISLSRSDGTSTALLEALSCGLYPLVSDIPQNREWISEGEANGQVIPFDRPEALAAALELAIRDGEARRHAAAVNRAKIVERADSGRNMERLASYIRQFARS